MLKITGRAKRFDGTAIDYVSLFNWSDGKCIAQVKPDAAGVWNYYPFRNVTAGITYIADGCEPITHGSYSFEIDNSAIYNPILHYKFNGDYLDSSPSNLNGRLVGVSNFVEGRKGDDRALEFNNTVISTPDNLPINSDKISFSLWAYVYPNPSTGMIYELSSDLNNNNNSTYLISAEALGAFQSSQKATSDAARNTVNSNLVAGSWIHIVVTIDRSLPALEEHKMYINNTLASTYSENFGETSGNFGDYKLYIGDRNNTPYSVMFKGRLQDFRVYNYALNADEREALFNE